MRFGIFCPLYGSIGRNPNSYLVAENLNCPWQNGIRVPKIYGSLSGNDGVLKKFFKDIDD